MSGTQINTEAVTDIKDEITEITENMEGSSYTLGLFLKYQKKFDTVYAVQILRHFGRYGTKNEGHRIRLDQKLPVAASTVRPC